MKSQIKKSLLAAFFSCLVCACQGSDMVRIAKNDTVGTAEFMMDVYEAKISTTGTPGANGSNARATSVAGQTPTSGVTYDDAKTACETAGKRLCTSLEFKTACIGTNNTSFGFQDSADTPNKVANVCNVGKAVDSTNGVATTGKFSTCKSDGYGIYDLVGNLSEWTTKGSASHVSGSNVYSDVSATTNYDCSFEDTTTANVDTKAMGFRCCKTP